MIPKRSKSYLAAPVCIISTAQHARPKVMGHREPRRTQFKRLSTFDITYSEAFDRPTGPNVARGWGEDEGEGEGEYEEEEKQRVEWRRVGLGVAGEVRARRDAVLDTTAIVFCLSLCVCVCKL